MRDIKYFGILRDFDLSKVNSENFHSLIDLNLFDKQELSVKYKSDEDYKHIELTSNDNFSDFFGFNRFEYHIKKDIYNEMYLLDLQKIETKNYYFLSNEITIIDFELEMHFNKKYKKQILETFHKKHFQNIDSDIMKNYLLYKNGTSALKNYSFFDYYIESIKSNIEDSDNGLFNFLKGIDVFFATDLKKDFELFHRVETICSFCEKSLKKIKNNKYVKAANAADIKLENGKNDIQNELLFDQDGLKIFSYICEKYTSKKNAAFYSYLYHFLQDKNKMISPSKTSVEYVNFVKGINQGLKYSKVIQTTSGSESKKIDIFKGFENIYKSYLKTTDVNLK